VTDQRAVSYHGSPVDLTLVVAGWPAAEFEANKADIEGNYLKMFEMAPEFAERVGAAKRTARFAGTSVPNFFRRPSSCWVHGNQEAMDGFARVNAGVTSPAEFFSEDNIGRIFAAAAAR